jgi:hypothetical protein
MSRKAAPKRRTWTKVHLTFFTTPSHDGIGPDALLVMLVVFALARWDGESEHAEARDEKGGIVPLRTLCRLSQLTMPRVQAAVAAAVACGTLAQGPNEVLVVPNFRKWQETPDAARMRKRRERERRELAVPEDDRLQPVAAPEDLVDAHPWRRDLGVLKWRHTAFLEALPEGPRRLRVVWLYGTPNEQAEGLERETTWVAEVLFGGQLEPARRVVLEVFEHAWRRAYAGELDERYLAKSLWGQAFRARVREWADALREHSGESGKAEVLLTWEQLEALSAEAAKDLKPVKGRRTG